MTGTVEIQLQHIGDLSPFGNTERRTASRQRQRSAAHHILGRTSNMIHHPSGRIGLGEIEHLNPAGQIAHQPFRHHRAQAFFAQH